MKYTVVVSEHFKLPSNNNTDDTDAYGSVDLVRFEEITGCFWFVSMYDNEGNKSLSLTFKGTTFKTAEEAKRFTTRFKGVLKAEAFGKGLEQTKELLEELNK